MADNNNAYFIPACGFLTSDNAIAWQEEVRNRARMQGVAACFGPFVYSDDTGAEKRFINRDPKDVVKALGLLLACAGPDHSQLNAQATAKGLDSATWLWSELIHRYDGMATAVTLRLKGKFSRLEWNLGQETLDECKTKVQKLEAKFKQYNVPVLWSDWEQKLLEALPDAEYRPLKTQVATGATKLTDISHLFSVMQSINSTGNQGNRNKGRFSKFNKSRSAFANTDGDFEDYDGDADFEPGASYTLLASSTHSKYGASKYLDVSVIPSLDTLNQAVAQMQQQDLSAEEAKAYLRYYGLPGDELEAEVLSLTKRLSELSELGDQQQIAQVQAQIRGLAHAALSSSRFDPSVLEELIPKDAPDELDNEVEGILKSLSEEEKETKPRPVLAVCHADPSQIKTKNNSTWYIDTGSKDTISPDISDFDKSTYKLINDGQVVFGNGQALDARGIGDIVINVRNPGGTEQSIRLTNCLHVPGCKFKLVSIRQATRAGAELSAKGNTCTVTLNGKLLIHASNKLPSGLYEFTALSAGKGLPKPRRRPAGRAQQADL